jgi:hypothetical protein
MVNWIIFFDAFALRLFHGSNWLKFCKTHHFSIFRKLEEKCRFFTQPVIQFAGLPAGNRSHLPDVFWCNRKNEWICPLLLAKNNPPGRRLSQGFTLNETLTLVCDTLTLVLTTAQNDEPNNSEGVFRWWPPATSWRKGVRAQKPTRNGLNDHEILPVNIYQSPHQTSPEGWGLKNALIG